MGLIYTINKLNGISNILLLTCDMIDLNNLDMIYKFYLHEKLKMTMNNLQQINEKNPSDTSIDIAKNRSAYIDNLKALAPRLMSRRAVASRRALPESSPRAGANRARLPGRVRF